MGDDPGRDFYPVKETASKLTKLAPRLNEAKDEERMSMVQSQDKRALPRWSRDELEHQYYRIYDENGILKKHARKQEDKIKRLATKLIRLMNDHKKQDQEKGNSGRKRDIETEQIIEEQQDRLREVERHNKLLQEKLMVVRQQLATQLKRPVPAIYRHVTSRVDSGVPKSPSKQGNLPHNSVRPNHAPYTFYSSSRYVEDKAGNQAIDETIGLLREQLEACEQENLVLKEQLEGKDADHMEEMIAMKSQLSQEQRHTLHENISMIRLQRELKQKSSQLMVVQAQCADLEENVRSSQRDSERLVSSLEVINEQLKQEQNKNVSLQLDVASLAELQMRNAECREKITDLQNENTILRESNDKLMNNALDYEKYRTMNTGSARNDAVVQAELPVTSTEIGRDIDRQKIVEEREMRHNLEHELNRLRASYDDLNTRHDVLKEKMVCSSKVDDDANLTEFDEAMAYVRRRREKSLAAEVLQGPEEDDSAVALRKNLLKVQADHAETIQELGRTRDMLVAQHAICQDYQKEVDTVNGRLSRLHQQHESRMHELGRQLELRSARIQHLEKQLKNVMYGTTRYELQPENDNAKSDSDKSIDLVAGENVFEIHFHKLNFTKEGLEILSDTRPTTCLTWRFYYFDAHSTPSVVGSDPEYNYTSQYRLTVDEVFLHYANHQRVTLELQLVTSGTELDTVATAQIGVREALEKPQGRLRGTVPLIGIHNRETGMVVGTLAFWIRLCYPLERPPVSKFETTGSAVEHADRSLPILANDAPTSLNVSCTGQSANKNGFNDLHIKIIRCQGIQSRIKGSQPSSYCVYKFHTRPDHDTAIVRANRNPQFDDHSILQLTMDARLDHYLRSKAMEIFVFDDNDPELAVYMGVARIPLLPLAHHKEIKGTFELKRDNGQPNGSIEIHVYWQREYTAPDGVALKTTKPVVSNNGGSLPPAANKPLSVSQDESEKPTTPTPKPRRVKGTSSINDKQSLLQSLDKKPPVVPRDSFKATDAGKIVAANVSGSSPKKLPSKVIQPSSSLEIGSSSSGSASETDDSDIVVAGPSGYSQPKPVNNSNHLNGFATKPPALPLSSSALQSKNVAVGNENDGHENESGVESDSNVDTAPVKAAVPASDIHLSKAVVILISHLSFTQNATFLNDANIQMLFVEYRFLDYPSEELETPFSLPKPAVGQRISYNFRKVFYINEAEDEHKFKLFRNVIRSSNEEKRRITFTIVSEPSEDSQDVECEDLGYAYVDLGKVVREKKDIENEDIEVHDINDPKLVVGHLNVTVQALAAITFEN